MGLALALCIANRSEVDNRLHCTPLLSANTAARSFSEIRWLTSRAQTFAISRLQRPHCLHRQLGVIKHVTGTYRLAAPPLLLAAASPTPSRAADGSRHSRGWSLRVTGCGEGDLFTIQGAMIPFAATEAERQRAGDPRPSLETRYGSARCLGNASGRGQEIVDRAVLSLKDAGVPSFLIE